MFGYRQCEGFYIVRTACRVNHLVQMAFFHKKELLVASQVLRELIRLLVLLVERNHCDRVNACKSSRHSFGLRAKQVDVSVEDGLVEFGSDSMNSNLARALALRSILLHYLSPKHASCAEFCKFHEVVGRDTHIELDSLCSIVGRNACISKDVHPFGTPSKSIAEFLIDISTGVAEQV